MFVSKHFINKIQNITLFWINLNILDKKIPFYAVTMKNQGLEGCYACEVKNFLFIWYISNIKISLSNLFFST